MSHFFTGNVTDLAQFRLDRFNSKCFTEANAIAARLHMSQGGSLSIFRIDPKTRSIINRPAVFPIGKKAEKDPAIQLSKTTIDLLITENLPQKPNGNTFYDGIIIDDRAYLAVYKNIGDRKSKVKALLAHILNFVTDLDDNVAA